MEKALLHCRQENGSMCIPPMETSFGHWNMLLLSQDENPIIGRIFAGNTNIWFFRCLPNRDVISSLNPPNSHDPNGGTYIRIGGLLKEKKTIFWSITKLGKSVRRMIREGSLALFRTSYKELSQRGIHPSSGVHHLFLKKETSFTQNKPASHWPSLVCPISPPLLNGFQSSLTSLESYFQGESNAVCYEGRGLLFMENVGNYRNCATRIILETIGVNPIRTYPFWTLPLTLGVFFLHFPLLGVIFGVDFRQKHGFH